MEVRDPVVRRLAVAVGVIFRFLPDIPVSVWVILGAAGLFEPLMLVAGVVDDEVEDELHATLVQLVAEDIHILDSAIWRIDLAVVADIVTLKRVLASPFVEMVL